MNKYKNGAIKVIYTLLIFLLSVWITNNLYKSLLIAIIFYLVILNFSIYRFKHEKRKLRKSTLDIVDTMDGFKFEHYLCELFKAHGYKVERTQDRNDFGADLILTKHKQRIVVQAKRYKGKVGIKAVQEIVSALFYYKADFAWVVSNSEYTPAAIELANKSDVKLIGRNELAKLMEKTVKENIQHPTTPFCPECGEKMILRKSEHGLFYGCSTFPKCRGTVSANKKGEIKC